MARSREDDASLEAAVRRARERWPGIGGGVAELAVHVSRLSGPVGDIARFGDELHLACASCLHDDRALWVLEHEYLAQMGPALARLRVADDFVDEVIQELRHRLVLPPEPRLEKYSATGPLTSWMRVVTLRLGLDLKRDVRPRNDEDLAPMLSEQAPLHGAEGVDVERYRSAILAAIRHVFLQLRPEDRNLLRLHHLEGVSLDKLAALNGVHRATIARWLAELRERVLRTTEEEMALRYRLTKSEFRSVFRRAQSNLDAFNVWREVTELPQ